MTDDNRDNRQALIARQPGLPDGSLGAPRLGPARLFGSLRDALLAAGREPAESTSASPARAPTEYELSESTVRYTPPMVIQSASVGAKASGDTFPQPKDASRAAQQPKDSRPRDAQAREVQVRGTQNPVELEKVGSASRVHAAPNESAHALSPQVPRTQPIARGQAARSDGAARTQMLRGRQKVSRANFHQDPVVGWLVIVGGPGLGAHRSIFEGNNTVGRASTQRVPIDFGDDTISSEEQAYIRYDSNDRSFLFVPNLAKTNVVQVNDKKPTGAVALQPMDVITMGRTQLVFVPFCGPDFDWSELSEVRE